MTQSWRSTAGVTLFILFCASVLAFLDRQLLNIVVAPIKAEMAISDVQFSLLQGVAFSAVYCLTAFPIAFLSDRASRKWVIVASILFWNVMTLCFGLASSFGMLLVARMGLAIGEAGLSPAAVSMIRQLYPAERQSFAVALMALSMYVGGGISMVIGGPAIDALAALDAPLFGLSPWRLLYLSSFLIGLVVLAMVLMLREPPRPAASHVQSTLRDFVNAILARRSAAICYLTAGIGLNALVYAIASWTPAMLMRTYGWSAQQTGLSFGLVYLLCGIAGALTAGRIVPRLRAAEMGEAVGMLMRLASVAVGLGVLLAAFSPTGGVALAFLCVAMFGIGAIVAVGIFGFQALFAAEFSARAVALNFLISSSIGASAGPSLVALLAQGIGGGDRATGPALGIFTALAALWSALWLTAFLRSLRSTAARGQIQQGFA